MKFEVYFAITIRIVILFVVGMLFTFVPDYLREFFGDVDCTGKTYELFGKTYQGCRSEFVNDGYDWGARHYWYTFMMLCLFLLSIINVIVAINKILKKHYPETF